MSKPTWFHNWPALPALLVWIVAATAVPAATVAAQETESRMTGLSLSSDEPIQIESDLLQINEETSQATFTGNVKVVQGDTVLQAGEMIVHYAQDGGSVASGTADISEIDLFKKVLIQSGNQTATADTGNFDMASEVLVLSGEKVILTEAENVFIGCKLTVYMQNGQARLESCGRRVMIQLDPKSRPQQ